MRRVTIISVIVLEDDGEDSPATVKTVVPTPQRDAMEAITALSQKLKAEMFHGRDTAAFSSRT